VGRITGVEGESKSCFKKLIGGKGIRDQVDSLCEEKQAGGKKGKKQTQGRANKGQGAIRSIGWGDVRKGNKRAGN